MKITISVFGKDYYISKNYFNDYEKAINDYINFTKKTSKHNNCLICLIQNKRIINKAICNIELDDLYFL